MGISSESATRPFELHPVDRATTRICCLMCSVKVRDVKKVPEYRVVHETEAA